jgi:hypothetical protein
VNNQVLYGENKNKVADKVKEEPREHLLDGSYCITTGKHFGIKKVRLAAVLPIDYFETDDRNFNTIYFKQVGDTIDAIEITLEEEAFKHYKETLKEGQMVAIYK